MPEISNVPDFPGNSIKAKVEVVASELSPQTSKIARVVTSKVIKRKKSFLDSFAETFFGDDAKTVGSYVVWDVLLPAAKNTISEMVSTGIEMLLFGSPRGDRTRRDRDRSVVNYTGYANKSRNRNDRESYRNRDRDRDRIPARHKFDDILIESRGEAEEVLSSLVDQIEQYDMATISDFYDLVGLPTEFTDNKWGWDNLSRATVNRVRGGYILVLPRPVELD